MIYMAIKNDQDAKTLQNDLMLLCEWERKWMIEFHPDKREILSITRKKHPITYPYQLHGQHLKHCDYAKYLGINISNDMRWTRPVFFNRGSAEPKGSASVCQGFRSWPVTNNLACEITPDNVVEILSVDFFV